MARLHGQPSSNQRQVPTVKESLFGKWAFSYLLDSILAKRATIVFSLHTLNCLSVSKN